MTTKAALRDVARHGWPRSFPVVQIPNAPLVIALIGSVVSSLTHGSVHAYARAVFFAFLAAWAWLEVTDGANWVRRAIGVAGLAYAVIRVADLLGA